MLGFSPGSDYPHSHSHSRVEMGTSKLPEEPDGIMGQ